MVTIPTTIQNETLWRERCQKMRALAQRIINRDVGIIEGAQQMHVYRGWLHAEADDDFQVFSLVDRDAKNLPSGYAQGARGDDIRRLAAFYHDDVIAAATKIVAKYRGT